MTTIALVAHRIADRAPSGIGRYYRGLIGALAGDPGPAGLVVVTPRESGQPDWLPPGVGWRAIPGPRRALQFGWTVVQRPRIDGWTGDVDVVHALHTWAPVPTRRPLIVTVHDIMPVLNPGWYRWDHRWGLLRGLRYAVERADRIVAVSSWVASLLESECAVAARRITVVPHGVNDRFRTAPTEKQTQAVERRWGLTRGGYLLAVGQVTPRKNLLTVVRAVSALTARVPLVIAGSPGPASADVDAEVARLGLGDQVRVLGYVPDDLLVPLIAGALALVHPSRDEGFGLTPIEAMAAGTPVIASRAASLPEVVGGAGLLVDPDDTVAWAEAIRRVTDDDGERRRLIEAGAERQAASTWPAAARATLAVYRDVMRGS